TLPKPVSKSPPFWENIILLLKEQFTMKRTVFALGAALALFVFAFLAFSALRGIGQEEPGVIAENPTVEVPSETAEPTTVVIEPTEPVEVAELPALPSLSNATGLGGGFGGGGGGGVGATGETVVSDSAPASAPAPELGMRIFNPLSGTEFILNTTLPIEPTSAVVYQQPSSAVFTVDDVSRLAALFNMNGPVYTQSYNIEEDFDWIPPAVYQVFDGSRNLSVGNNYLFYYDESGNVYLGSGPKPMPFEQAAPIAEAFLQQSGLVDFQYRMVSQNGYDIEVHRLVDGREAIYPEIQLSVNDSGEVWSFSYNPLSGLSELADYPLRSAEDSWQYMLDNGVDFQSVFFNIYSNDVIAPVEPGVQVNPTYWQRTFEAGAEVTLYSYPTVYESVSGDVPPRILLDTFLVSGPTDELQAIADYAGKQIHVQGVAGEKNGNIQALELVSWEPVQKDFTFREGTMQITDGQAMLVTDDAEGFIIPDVPADLDTSKRMYVSGWIEENGRGETPTFNWQSMGIIDPPPDAGVVGEPEPLPIDVPINPFMISQVTISEVNLQYAVLSVWDETTQSASFFLQPVWQFKGTTDTNSTIEIYVQAIDSQYITQPAG
ncbi:MAG: hypothetical protein WAM60_18260, partial [Candidatus Promineifilaceae bacterium]